MTSEVQEITGPGKNEEFFHFIFSSESEFWANLSKFAIWKTNVDTVDEIFCFYTNCWRQDDEEDFSRLKYKVSMI